MSIMHTVSKHFVCFQKLTNNENRRYIILYHMLIDTEHGYIIFWG